ncbi:hypothetical protein GCM10010965_06210 [Caldalkalibacillus thermarum]|uniref:SPOR domain-containing protein n=1 Tax=Caldalkalibacillus thermarum TaxID=296745 RepID=UPI00166446B5|nr:SPOR domain-containing protein [Caldalkalibacillus thermarum]GGK15940.1 hypothetical protein GCM10010965_06210 [Caldalkalibacillus thermarum]
MTTKNKLTFLFPPDKDGDHPDIQWETCYTGRTINTTARTSRPENGNRKDSRIYAGSAQRPSWSREINNEEAPSLIDERDKKAATRRPSLPPSRSGRRSKNKSKKQTSRTRLSLPKLKVGSKLALIAASAIALGVIMGMMVLALFAEQGAEQAPASATDSQMSAVHSQDSTGANGALMLPAGHVQDGRLYLPSRTYYVVQAGAFSEQQAAEKVREQLERQGLAGLVSPGEAPYRIYMGLAVAKDDAERLGIYVKQEGIEVYVRTHETREIEADISHLEEDLSVLPAYLARGDQLLGDLARTSLVLLEQRRAKLTEEEWKDLQEQHRLFLKEGQALLAGLNGEMARAGEQLLRELSAAITALEAYRKQSHPSYLWQVQQASLNYLAAYEHLVSHFIP